MNELDLHYPPDSCPFCGIAKAYPEPGSRRPGLQNSSNKESTEARAESDLGSLEACVPRGEVQGERTSPSSFVVAASKHVVAFLDILPMVGGHLLVATREHRVKVADMKEEEGREMGFWLPILSRVVAKVTGVTDYNIVQNNGARAAQVVPHVHFHIIPRPGTMPEIKSKSWTMFGRGQRDELDDEEGAKLAGEMRRVLKEELERTKASPKL
ncbi:HIT-like protein [Massarina eburnea CBS 473.64]|uniref:HIT-like protein n=1 Tax=Massarina eburnea CBS 473.64 TaxID=1395130 RepID=A0A6A6RPI0_9PLEO|nr:HIT-like protein [Massarina eburnea CBS 473.64]